MHSLDLGKMFLNNDLRAVRSLALAFRYATLPTTDRGRHGMSRAGVELAWSWPSGLVAQGMWPGRCRRPYFKPRSEAS